MVRAPEQNEFQPEGKHSQTRTGDPAHARVRSVVSDSSVTPGTVARRAPLSVGFPRPEHWSGVPPPHPGDLLDPGSNLHLLCLRHGQADPHHHATGKPHTETPGLESDTPGLSDSGRLSDGAAPTSPPGKCRRCACHRAGREGERRDAQACDTRRHARTHTAAVDTPVLCQEMFHGLRSRLGPGRDGPVKGASGQGASCGSRSRRAAGVPIKPRRSSHLAWVTVRSSVVSSSSQSHGPCDPMDWSPSGSSACRILQARILEWLAIASSGGASQPGIEPVSLTSLALAGLQSASID